MFFVYDCSFSKVSQRELCLGKFRHSKWIPASLHWLNFCREPAHPWLQLDRLLK